MMHHIVIKSAGVGLALIIATVIDEKTQVPIAVVITITAAWGSALWWLGRKLQTLEDGLKVALKDRDEAKDVMARLVRKVDSLPCNGDECETHRKRKVDRGQ